MEPYGTEFRGEVLAACDAHEGTRVIAVRFRFRNLGCGESNSSVVRRVR